MNTMKNGTVNASGSDKTLKDQVSYFFSAKPKFSIEDFFEQELSFLYGTAKISCNMSIY